jgi:glycerophosphoryl diester phosphodiesterase
MTDVIAHRGAAGAARENTLAAFLAAREAGADGVEFDVRSTLDGRLVVHHDPVLADGTVLGVTRSSDLPSYVPSLDEALDACAGLITNVELKADPTPAGMAVALAGGRLAAHLLAARRLAGRSWAEGDGASPVVVSSFSVEVLEAFDDELRASARPMESAVPIELALLVSPGHPLEKDPIEIVSAHHWSGIHPFFWMADEALVARARHHGLAVRAWTVDAADEIERLAALGVDAVVTNDVATALAALGRTSRS